MTENTQQQKKTATPKQVTQTNSVTATITVAQCPNCHAELPEDAMFCPECATPLNQLICPKCGKANSLNADICDHCKTWLLDGHCKFCYAELDLDSSFCPECGKPQDGIICPNCGHKDIFDFCSKCGKAVTEEAIAETQAKQVEEDKLKKQEAQLTAEIAELEAIINQPPPEPVNDEGIDDVYDPDDYVPDELEVIPVEAERKSLFSNNIMDSIRQTGSEIDSIVQKRIEAQRIEEEKRKEAARIAEEKRIEAARIAEEKRKELQRIADEKRKKDEARRIAEEEEKQRQIKEAQDKKIALMKQQEKDRMAKVDAKKNAMTKAQQNRNKKFKTNHDARKFHFENHHPDAIGWECNRYGTIHLYSEGGPNDCSQPSDGGCDFFGTMADLYKDEYDLWQRKDKR